MAARVTSPNKRLIGSWLRAHQNLIWDRTSHTNRLRNDLREFFPAALEVFGDLAGRDALAVLAKAPNPTGAARLSITQIRGALKRGGRQRNLDRRATEIKTGLRTTQARAPEPVAAAFATSTTALVQIITELNKQIDALKTELSSCFE